MLTRRSLYRPVAVLLALTLAGAALQPAPAAAAPTTGAATVTADVGTLAATAGCGRAPGLNSGTHTIQSNGKSRSFILRLPGNYNNNNPYRLVFGFHWWGGTAVDVDTGQTVQRDVWSYYGLQRLANNSAIFVAPQGLGNGWANAGGEDVTFVDDMLRVIEQALCVETTQRFAVGFSYGGAMSYALACARANVFRAVAVYGAPRELSGCSGGSQPIAYFGAHGISDNITSGRALRDRFVRNNGCTAQNPPEPAQGSLTHRTTTYSGCRAGYPVVWAAFDGGHIAAPQDGAPGDSGSRTWLPGETWNFFTQFGGTTPPPGNGGIPTGWARITNVATGLSLDSGGSVPTQSMLKQWSYNGNSNLQWQLVDSGGGFYRLVNRTNGMVADSWGDASNGATAVQAPWNGHVNQQWRLTDLGNGRYQVINRGTGTALDSGGDTTVGSRVKLWAPDGSPNLQWTITAI
ncbi:cellulose-binding protein [Micromonospora zingiberis]|uniref:Cellulose-binding protein n=1 Tax=Micromonospora zingiberis TaxID=2053011 RepID=A0A4R0GX66_9ACTN|nr:RICIN domain-containing protein [Micromonospora zingiberis]TCC00462.1 cellulose-binding protein [Micromonospora zingiberis]